MEVKIVENVRGDEIGPELILHWYSPEIPCHGVVVVDTTVHGKSTGGTRMLPDITTREISALARDMTFKYATMGRPRGGGKAGIWANPGAEGSQREKIMRAFGRALKPLAHAGIFFAGADMGTLHSDLVWVREETGQEAPLPKFWLEEKDGESLDYHFTGYGVVAAAQAAFHFLGKDIAQASVAIEGFGKVGSGVARYGAQLGAKVVAVSTLQGALYNERGLEVSRLLELRKSLGDHLVFSYGDARMLRKEDLFFLPVDLLVPGTRPWVIHQQNCNQIQTRVICSGANIPLTEEAEELLFQKGVTVIPDFISNVGGSLSSQLGTLEVTVDQAFGAIEKIIGSKVLEVLEAASREKISPTRFAQERARETIKKWKTPGAPSEGEYLQNLKKVAQS